MLQNLNKQICETGRSKGACRKKEISSNIRIMEQKPKRNSYEWISVETLMNSKKTTTRIKCWQWEYLLGG